MKKLISLLCTAAMLPSAISLADVRAASEASVTMEGAIPYVFCEPELLSGRKKATENPDLYALASSLGADDDYFNFPNYTTTEMGEEAIEMLVKWGKGTMESVAVDTLLAVAGIGGVCYGYSTLQVLTHNGIISPSDIQEGAETLYDIVFDDKVNDAIFYYQCTQAFIQDNVMGEYYCSYDDAEACADLIYHGEKAMESGKYFQICYSLPQGLHAVTGIGIAEGNWVYNDKTYDKCILTLDSNAVYPDDETRAYGFKEKCCVFINSEEGNFYIPGYEASSENENTDIFSIVDDMDLLNHFGMFNPSESINEDYYDIQELTIWSDYSVVDMTTEYNGVSETYHAEKDSIFDGMDNCLINFGVRYYYKKIDNLMFETSDALTKERTTFGLLGKEFKKQLSIRGNVRVSMNERNISLEPIEEEAGCYNIRWIQVAPDKPHYLIDIGTGKDRKLNGKLSVDFYDDGVRVIPTDTFEGYYTLSTFSSDNTVNTGNFDFAITSVDDFFLKFVSDTEPPVIMIDLDDDGVFESEVQKGDVNCDGKITASDAANVLSAYSADQADNRFIPLAAQNHYINENIADYNGDGSMTAVDAALILSDYAQSQVA